MFEQTLLAGWGDMDFNGHMRNTAYLDKSGDVRMLFFAQNGFPMAEFSRLRIGPVVMKDEVEYAREVNLLDQVRITLELAGMSDDGSRWCLRNTFYRPDGRLSAKVSSLGGWLDGSARRLIAPPDSLFAAMRALSRSDDFQTLPSSLKT